MTEPATGICRVCLAPVPLDARGVVDRHREQIVAAQGWVDGYVPAEGKDGGKQ